MFNEESMMPPPEPRQPLKHRRVAPSTSNLYKGLMYNEKRYPIDPDRLVFFEPVKNPKNGSVSVVVKIGITIDNKEHIVPLEIQTPKMMTKNIHTH